MDLEFRSPADWDEYEAVARMVTFVFADTFDLDRFGRSKAYRELDRVLVAYDRDRPVAAANAYSFSLSVPGQADVAAAGVSGVAVLPTHRRRGVLTTLMRRQLEDVHRRGEPLAVLWASETPIYGRFGYGLGTLGLSWEIDRRSAAFSSLVPSHGEAEVRLVDPADMHAAVAPIYARLRATTPGMVGRSDPWWQARRLYDPSGKLACVVVHEGRTATGYALYSITSDWDPNGLANNTVATSEVAATTPLAYRTLWGFLLDIDLAGRITAWQRPVDDPLLWLLHDPRALQTRVGDGLWVRLVDVAHALAARRYACEARLVLEVADAFCPWNDQRWVLDASPDGASCKPAPKRAKPDLSLSAADLGVIYLGGAGLSPLVRAGRVVEHRPGAARLADQAFRWDRAPWASTFF